MSFENLKKQEKEQRREYIIDAAEKLFIDKGYDNVPMNDIAKEIGVNRATIYLYFKNKDSLYFAVLLRGLRLMRDAFQKSVKEEQTGLERLIALCRAFFSYCQEHPEYYQELCYARTRSFDMSQVESANEQMVVAKELIDTICDSIKQGIGDGTMRRNLEPMETAVFVMTNCEKIVQPGREMIWALESQNITLDGYMKYSLDLLISAIASKKKDLGEYE